MSEPLERDEVIKLLNVLGSDKDEEALLAARALHSKIAQASLSWDELLVADETEDNELEEKNQIMVKQLKNRYNDPTVNRKFIVGVDRSKMRLYDVEQKAQEDLVDTGQEEQFKSKKPLGEFSDFKV